MAVASVMVMLLIALLAIPVTLNVQVSKMRKYQSHYEVCWFYNHIQISIPANKSERSEIRTHKSKPDKSPSKSQTSAKARSSAFLFIGDVRQCLIVYTRSLIKSLRFANLYLHARIGLGDPADTGQLWSVGWLVSAVLAKLKQATIHIEPDFLDHTLTLEGQTDMQLVPLQILCVTARLLLSIPILKAIAQR